MKLLLMCLVSWMISLSANCDVIVDGGKYDKSGKIGFPCFKEMVFLKSRPGSTDYRISIKSGKLIVISGKLPNSELENYIPEPLTGDWEQSSILNAPVLVRGALTPLFTNNHWNNKDFGLEGIKMVVRSKERR